MEEVKKARRAAIRRALTYLEDGVVVAFGTGSTMAQAAEEVKKLIEEKKMNLKFIPSSIQSKLTLLSLNLKLASLEEYPRPDILIDSFDQVDREGNVIKGGGAALLREKVLAQASRKVIYVGDYLKLSSILNKPIPVEILEYAYPHVERRVRELGMDIKLRDAGGKAGPVISDNGNLIADIDAGEVREPAELEEKLKRIAGVIEVGLFPRPADKVIVGRADRRVEEMEVTRRRL